MKKCSRCNKTQPLSNFYTRKRHSDGLEYNCKKCLDNDALNYRRTKNGLVSKIYGSQKTSSKQRGHNPPNYTLKELREWVFSQPNFEELYNNWVCSNYNKNKYPSIDRLDDSKGYFFDNIRLVTWEKNNKSAYVRRKLGKTITEQNKPVVQMDLNGNEIKTYASIRQAQRENKITHILEVCKNTRSTSGGYKWKYAINN